MKNLVTGCACFIGSHLVDKLLDEVIGKGLGYVGLPKLFCKQKPLLKNAYASFLQAKRNISLVKLLKLFKRKVCDKRIGIVQRKLFVIAMAEWIVRKG